jgi:SEC-C motif-containing protein
MSVLCLCHSGKLYSDCCRSLHQGVAPENALKLMRSRYSAYAANNPEYIMRTTHPESPHFMNNRGKWKGEILQFSQQTQFQNLEILEFINGEREAYVTFLAKLSQAGIDTSFVEKSRFERAGGRWLYCSGVKS